MTKGPTFEQTRPDVQAASGRAVEVRTWTQYNYESRMGQSNVTIVCPFCQARVKTYLWSLAGGGKRCPCGAIFGSMGNAYHWAGRTSSGADT